MGLPKLDEIRGKLRANIINLERERMTKKKKLHLTERVPLEMSPEQKQALARLQEKEAELSGKPHKSRMSYIRSVIAARYAEVFGEDFPPDPQYGGRREKHE